MGVANDPRSRQPRPSLVVFASARPSARGSDVVAVVRSTHRGPVSIAMDLVQSDDEEEWVWWWEPPPEEVAYEESLPDPFEGDWYSDPYENRWDNSPSWASALDDSPAWEAGVWSPCERCGHNADLDPLHTCERCRVDDGRCFWCGLDPVVYDTNSACRTCYQQIRRETRVTSRLEMRLAMLDAAFRRADLRKRRQSTQ